MPSPPSGMAGSRPFLVLFGLICACLSDSAASIIRPVSDAHRSAALELFVPVDGSFPSLEVAYEALRTFQILGLGKTYDISHATCPIVSKQLGSSSKPEDLFHALRVNSILRCQIGAQTFEDAASKLLVSTKDANSLMDLCYSVLSLLQIKKQGPNVVLSDADGIFDSIKALGQSDGRWRYDSSNAESSTYAAGIALETLAGVVSLAASDVDQSKIKVVKNDIVKLFSSIKSYDDGTLYFDENHIGGREYRDPLTTTASVVRGVTAFATIVSEKLAITGDNMLGLAKFFLSIGVPGNTNDLFNQLESLSCLENNRIALPLILSLPATVLSLTSKNHLKVEVTTVFGSAAPPLTVNLVQASSPDSEDIPVLRNKELRFDPENSIHYLDFLPLKLDVGKYILFFEISFHDPDHSKNYATGGRTKTLIFLTGIITVDKAEVRVLGTDAESAVTMQKLDLSRDNTVSLAANHLKKMRLTFQPITPLGHTFKPHQDFLGLVEKFYYLSGRYDIELSIGDAAMENSFLRALGHIKLDLPKPSEKAARPPPQSIDAYSRFGPKQEISHIFRAPEKRPRQELPFAFLFLTILPLAGLLLGLLRLGVNLKGFPLSSVAASFSILFHVGIGAALLLYVFFWLKLNLFTTLKALGFLGVFLIFVGHRTLSHLASTSTKLKTT